MRRLRFHVTHLDFRVRAASVVSLAAAVPMVALALQFTSYLGVTLQSSLDQQIRTISSMTARAPASATPYPDGQFGSAVCPTRRTPDGPVATGSCGMEEFTKEELNGLLASPGTIATMDVHGRPWRVLARSIPGDQAVYAYGSLEPVNDAVNRSRLINLALALLALGPIWGATWLLLNLLLRRLYRLGARARMIAAGDLSQRAEVDDPRTPLGRLTTVINAMLDRISEEVQAREDVAEGARSSEERMRRFVADAGHELRTPLTSIRGYAQFYRQVADLDRPAVDSIMQRIEEESGRLAGLADDLLTLARFDGGHEIDFHPVDLVVLAGDAVADARALATAHHVALDLRAEGPVVVRGDDGMLRQILTNLVTNALRHTPPGTHVTVRLGTVTGKAVLEVSDDGPGMTAEQADRVFERFYRVDQGRFRGEGGGSGLGLSIVTLLVEAHHGRLALETAPGQGATFRVVLPLAPRPLA